LLEIKVFVHFKNVGYDLLVISLIASDLNTASLSN